MSRRRARDFVPPEVRRSVTAARDVTFCMSASGDVFSPSASCNQRSEFAPGALDGRATGGPLLGMSQ